LSGALRVANATTPRGLATACCPLGPKNKAPEFKVGHEFRIETSNCISMNPNDAFNLFSPRFQGTAVVNGEFKPVSLKDYNGKWLILFFYPLDL
jgi:hypothetical protein